MRKNKEDMESKIILVSKKPMFWWIVKIFFPLYNFEGGIVFTFGKRIYSKNNLEFSVLVHEKVHCRQMRYSMVWGILHFIRYYFSRNYRFESELEAFVAQIREFLKQNKNFNDGYNFIRYRAEELSGPFYGNLCSYETARKSIMKWI